MIPKTANIVVIFLAKETAYLVNCISRPMYNVHGSGIEYQYAELGVKKLLFHKNDRETLSMGLCSI